MVRILVVDDKHKDIFMIKDAVEFCLTLLEPDQKHNVIMAQSAREAQEALSREKPTHILTDLFMPLGDFDRDLMARCDEIEFPQGLELMNRIKETDAAALATTFFWQYPGFSRYLDFLETCPNYLGTIPKDIFLLVHSLKKEQDGGHLSDYFYSRPFCILIQVLSAFLQAPPKTGIGKQLRKLNFRSWSEQASNWLSSYPSQVLKCHQTLTEISGSNSKETVSGKSFEAGNRNQIEEEKIIEHVKASRWMPCIILDSPEAKHPINKGCYRKLMNDIENEDWRIHIDLPIETLAPVETATKSKLVLKGQEIEFRYYSYKREEVWIPDFLIQGTDRDRRLAQLLLTLGFFTYWCHIPDYRNSLVPQELEQVIRKMADVHYGIPDTGEYNEGKAIMQIASDLESLRNEINEEIKDKFETKWFDQLKKEYTSVIARKRIGKKGHPHYNRFRYWLNGSLAFVETGPAH